MVLTPAMAKDDPELKAQRSRWQLFAEQGDAQAQYQLGKSWCCGYGPGYNTAHALYWFCRAARQGYAPAQFQIGQLYGVRTRQKPLSLAQEKVYAYAWYGLAAAQGHTLAASYQYALGDDLSANQLKMAQAWAADPAKLPCGEGK